MATSHGKLSTRTLSLNECVFVLTSSKERKGETTPAKARERSDLRYRNEVGPLTCVSVITGVDFLFFLWCNTPIMIFGGARGGPDFEQQLLATEADCEIEQTADGFEFHVVDSSALLHPHGISGLVKYDGNDIEFNLLMSSAIQPEVRPRVAELLVEMVTLSDRGTPLEILLCEAGQRTLPNLDPQMRRDVGSTIYSNLAEYQQWVRSMDSQRLFTAVPRSSRLQLKHGLGWVALERGMNERGQETVDQLLSKDLNVPWISDKEVLVAQGKDKLKGVSITAYSTVEKGLHHKCKSCSGEIHKDTTRVTTSYDVKIGGYDHHHYHPVCYAETDMQQLDLTTARYMKSEW